MVMRAHPTGGGFDDPARTPPGAGAPVVAPTIFTGGGFQVAVALSPQGAGSPVNAPTILAGGGLVLADASPPRAGAPAKALTRSRSRRVIRDTQRHSARSCGPQTGAGPLPRALFQSKLEKLI